jgi:TonB family protein
MKILTPISTRTELACSAFLALACHAAFFGLMPASPAPQQELEIALAKQSLAVTLIPAQPVAREPLREPLKEIKEVVRREEMAVPLREPVPPERTIQRTSRTQPERERTDREVVRRSQERLPERQEAVQPEERLLVIREEGDTTNEAFARKVSDAVDSLKLEYPRFAVEMEWEGRLLLSVHVSEQGRPGTIKLKASSGHAFLDRSAVRQVSGQARDHLFPIKEEAGEPVSYWAEVPVNFILRDSSVSAGEE